MREPFGYETRPIARRVTRPLHARREELRAAAEALFKPTLSRWPKPNVPPLTAEQHDEVERATEKQLKKAIHE
jgi:hypothetical protein